MKDTAEKISGLLKIIFKDGSSRIIYCYQIQDNGKSYWRYERNNGQILAKESHFDPKQMAINMTKVYNGKGEKGEIHYVFKHHKSYSTNHS